MAHIRCSGGIVLGGQERAWLIADPGGEVDDWRHHAAAPVVVGPAGARPAAVKRARNEAGRLVASGGPLVAAAGVDVGHGFRTARLDGGGEARRDAVLAALDVVGIGGLERLGERAAVLVALFGERATRRVGATAIAALEHGGAAALRLAVAASDVLGPEQLEEVLRWSLAVPAGAVPVPAVDTALVAQHLATVLGPFTARRRLDLLRSLWDDTLSWKAAADALVGARRRRWRHSAFMTWRRRIADDEGTWWRSKASQWIGETPTRAAMLTWVPQDAVWWEALTRAVKDALSATVLQRIALAAEHLPLEAAVLSYLDHLLLAVTIDVPQSADHFAQFGVRADEADEGLATGRARAVAALVIAATDPAPPGRPAGDGRPLAALLRDAPELAAATLEGGLRVYEAATWPNLTVGAPHLAPWRHLAGYSRVRDPRLWTHRGIYAGDWRPLAERLAQPGAGTPDEVELVDDGLWLADLADVVAAWRGHEQAAIGTRGLDSVDWNPPAEPPDPRLPRLESVPLALAGAAQLVALGASARARPKSWGALAGELVASAEALGYSDEFAVAPEVAAWHGRELDGTGLTFEVGRTPRQLADWGNFMGNCIATYADRATDAYALVALRAGSGVLKLNVAVGRSGERWVVDEALARFNEDPAADLRAAVEAWALHLRPRPTALPTITGPAPPSRRPGRAPSGRRPPARDRLRKAAEALGDAVGDPGPVPAVLAPIAARLGWHDDGDPVELYVAIARPRRAGPLAGAVSHVLASDTRYLPGLWEATCVRPLAAGLAAAGEGGYDLSRLADLTVPPSLRLALKERRVWAARATDLAGRRIREALGDLMWGGDAALTAAVVARPTAGFLQAAVLAATGAPPLRVAVSPITVDEEGIVPGRPRSSTEDWRAASAAAVEFGATETDVDWVFEEWPGRELLVPTAWLAPRGWDSLWARASRVARERARERADSVP